MTKADNECVYKKQTAFECFTQSRQDDYCRGTVSVFSLFDNIFIESDTISYM